MFQEFNCGRFFGEEPVFKRPFLVFADRQAKTSPSRCREAEAGAAIDNDRQQPFALHISVMPVPLMTSKEAERGAGMRPGPNLRRPS
ncbi:hypothetical protein GWI33_003207 [Rhynchophorus ferrugineus]|uniref:Uncharacterized protein n=1 Tax=Rhynchophorus ferrugineus TaxID=354439 RepID=A0A834IWY7_RHYFE|nr:hypothetical protein GWI33_003207 [Rhynchophorus ferrugineus]